MWHDCTTAPLSKGDKMRRPTPRESWLFIIHSRSTYIKILCGSEKFTFQHFQLQHWIAFVRWHQYIPIAHHSLVFKQSAWLHMGMCQYLWKYHLVWGLFTSINPSYFDVNYRGTRFWPTAIWSSFGKRNEVLVATGAASAATVATALAEPRPAFFKKPSKMGSLWKSNYGKTMGKNVIYMERSSIFNG